MILQFRIRNKAAMKMWDVHLQSTIFRTILIGQLLSQPSTPSFSCETATAARKAAAAQFAVPVSEVLIH